MPQYNYSVRFITFISISFIVLFTLTCAQQDTASLIKRVKPAVVTIITFSLSRRPEPEWSFWFKCDTLSQGSGFFINSNGDVITNYHVLYAADSAIIKTSDSKIYKITDVIAEDENSDIIMVATDTPEKSIQFLQISAEFPVEGEEILVIGSPLGLERTVSDGIVSSIRNITSVGKLIQITAPISPGSSGGPVINMKGQVIGVASFQIMEGQNLNFAVPGEKIQSLQFHEAQKLSLWTACIKCDEIFSTKELIDRGDAFLLHNKFETALIYLQKALVKNPHNSEIYFLIGRCFWFLKRYNDAIDYYQEAIRLNPNDASYYYNLAVAYSAIGCFDDAIKACKKTILINPDKYYYRCLLADLYKAKGRHSDAIVEWKKTIDAYLKWNRKHLSRAAQPHIIDGFYLYSNDFPDDMLNDVLFLYYVSLGEAYCNTGDTNAALKVYKFLKDRDTTRAKELYEKIYPPINVNKIIPGELKEYGK